MVGRPEPHFSFSGLKTAVRQQAHKAAPLTDQDIADLCASFEAAVAISVADRCRRAFAIAAEHLPADAPKRLVVAGGVAANQQLLAALTRTAADHGYTLHVPPIALCGDNGAMIAWTGAERFARGLVDGLDFAPRPRWPLDATAVTVLGFGKSGAKA